MQQATLHRLIEARRKNRPAVLVRWLANDQECLVIEGEDGLEALDPRLQALVLQSLRADRSAKIETSDGALFLQVFSPPLRLLVIGAVHIAQSLVPMAALAGYDVTVIDPRRAFATDSRFPGVAVSREWPDDALDALHPDARTAIVALTHDPKIDDPALDRALRSPAFYIAALGSRRTHAARLERLAALGHDTEQLVRIYGPAGLGLGAISPAEIAVAIVAQMIQTLRQTHKAQNQTAPS